LSKSAAYGRFGWFFELFFPMMFRLCSFVLVFLGYFAYFLIPSIPSVVELNMTERDLIRKLEFLEIRPRLCCKRINSLV
jgi:hypothetical protein